MTVWKNGPPQFPEFVTMAIICSVIILLPISSHWKAKNVATLSMIAWLWIVNFIRIVNSIVWANNVDITLVVWCDITTKIVVGCTFAIPACALCICRYLEAVASIRWARQTETQKRNRRYFELFMCFGIPIIFMAIHYVVQGHRFDIIEHMGCQATAVRTWVTVVLMYVPPLILSIIAMGYAASAVRHFYRRRVDFKKHLSASNSGISPSRYLRLMLLAMTEIVVDTSFNVYILWVNVTQFGGLIPWTGWSDVHSNFSRIQQLPWIFFPPSYWTLLRFAWWIVPMGTIIFWGFFAFGQEAIAEYRCWWNWFQRRVLRRDIPVLNASSAMAHQVKRQGQKLGSNTNGSSNGGAGFPRIIIPKFAFRSKDSANTSSSSGSSPATLVGHHQKNKKASDGDSFVSADESILKQPISPISPVEVPNTAHYLEPELDTTVFDNISFGNISIGEAEDIREMHQQQAPSLASLGPYHPYYHQDSNGSATFASTGVRPDTPNVHTNDVRVTHEVEIEVV